MTKIIRILDRALDLLVLLLIALILAVSVYSLLDNFMLYRQADDPGLLKYKPRLDVPLSGRRTEAAEPDEPGDMADQVAWLCLEDTGIDYPVVQAEDNFAYLNRDPFGNFSLSGSIFLDSRNAPDFTDPYSLVYGHHMEHGKMFGSLDRYLDRAYFDAHRSGALVTFDAVWRLELFAVVSTDGGDRVLFNPSGRGSAEILAHVRDRATVFVPPTEEGPILALSTCYGDSYTSRLLVLGILIAE
ncbi:MAG: class B sortase [Oscillospiraceae bacterium]|nr:class B sortase [Oscillospiraceae bacterium]